MNTRISILANENAPLIFGKEAGYV